MFYATKTNNTIKMVSCENGLLHHFRSPVHILLMMFTLQSIIATIYSSKVTRFIAAIRSRELTTMTPLAVVVWIVSPTTSGRWQQGRGKSFGLQLSGAR